MKHHIKKWKHFKKTKKANINENLDIREEYYTLSSLLYERITSNMEQPFHKTTIAVGGESGSGKSTTAFCFEKECDDNGFSCTILHMDSYFKLPPKNNHQNRLTGLDNVGPHEVKLDLMNEHIDAFRNGAKSIEIPVVNYEKNLFATKTIDLSEVDILIVEGVYAFMLDNLDHKIFLTRTYLETLENRKMRTREAYDPIVEKVLDIEHQIVRQFVDQADHVIDQDYTLR